MKIIFKARLLIFTLIILLSFLQINCKKDTSPTAPDEPIPQNLFPLAVGRQWTYDYKETDLNGNVIIGRSGTHEIKVIRTQLTAGKQSFVLQEITKIGDNIDTTFNFSHIDINGNIWQYLLFESNDPNSPPGWVKTINRDLGLERTNVLFDTSLYVEGRLIRLQLTSIVKRKVSITVPLGQYNEAYPCQTELKLIVSGTEVKYKFTVWLVPGIGPVKFVEDISQDFGQPVIGYRVKELRSKNF